MNDKPSRARRWLMQTVRLAIVLLVFWFVRRTLVDAWDQLKEYRAGLQPGWLALACVFYGCGLLPPGVFWYFSLRALGQHPHFGETLRAYYTGHLGKYVPGKAMVVVIRAGMIRGDRVDVGVAAASVFLETLTWIASGSFLAAAYLAYRVGCRDVAFLGAIGLMALAGLPTLPPIFVRLARMARVGKSDPQTLRKLHRLGFKTIVLGWTLMPLGWGFVGLAYWATLRAADVPQVCPLSELARYTAAVGLATVAGFVALVIPAGLGVREAALAELMIPYLKQIGHPQPDLVAWLGAVLLRVVSVVSELGISGILYVVATSRRKHPPPDQPVRQNR